MLLTRSPLIHPASWASAFDLHVLSTPPAFVLSQDQTLRTKTKTLKPRKTNQKTRPAIPTKNTQKQKTGIKNKQTHYRVHKQHPHDRAHTNLSHVFERCFAPCFRDPSFSLRSLPFGATRKTIRTSPDIVKSSKPESCPRTFPHDFAILVKAASLNSPKIGDFHAPDHRVFTKMCPSKLNIGE